LPGPPSQEVGIIAPDGEGGGIAMMAAGWISGRGVTMRYLAETLSPLVSDRPVIDATNLDQVLDFHLTWTPDGAAATDGPGCPPSFKELADRTGVQAARRRLPVPVHGRSGAAWPTPRPPERSP
jgi:uncharacterized protein (TIGR03435 family)